jgi:uncharacterized protein Usg
VTAKLTDTRTRLATTAGVAQSSDSDFRLQLAGFSLTTAEIIYRLPDYPALLQSYVWQDYDIAPRFPKLKGFLEFWSAKLEGKLFKVTVAHSALLRPAELRLIGAEFKVH